MTLIVQKFGGTSVANADKIRAAAQRVVETCRGGSQVVVVVSARGHKTDELIALAHEITPHPPARELDMLLSTGEQESVALLAMAVQQMGQPAISFTGAQIGIVTDSTHTKARIRSIATQRMRQALEKGSVVIAAGFQGVDDEGNITTLGRGGSDTTAVALAAVLGADACEIYTDVEGVFSTDPRLVKAARKLERISYDEMLELASLGAGVMHSRSIEFAKKYRVPVWVKPSYGRGAGTLIAPETEEAGVVAGVALAMHEVRVTLAGIPDRPGVMKSIFDHLARRKIPIDMIVQDAAANGQADVSFTVPQDDLAETLTAAGEAVRELGAGTITHGTNLSKVSVVGSGMRMHTGVAAQMFASIAEAGANIRLITTSDIKISVLVDRELAVPSVASIHQGFKLDRPASAPGMGYLQRSERPEPAVNQDELARALISELRPMEDIVVSEIDLDREQSRVTIRRLPDVPGVSAQVFAAVAEGGVMVDLIVQNAGSDGTASISFTVPRADLQSCLLLLRELLEQWPQTELVFDKQIAKLSVKGIGLRTHTGVGQKMFAALSDAGVNVELISTSEIRISVLIQDEHGERARQALCAAFGLAE